MKDMKRYDFVKSLVDINGIDEGTVGCIIDTDFRPYNNRVFLVKFMCGKRNWMKRDEIVAV